MNHMLDDGPNIARPALRELLPRPCRECGARVASQALRVAARSQAAVAGTGGSAAQMCSGAWTI